MYVEGSHPRDHYRLASSLKPELAKHVVKAIPFKRMGRTDELRGVMTWLASDASSFCTGSECVFLA